MAKEEKFVEVEEMEDSDFAILQALRDLSQIMSKKSNQDIISAIRSIEFKLPKIEVPEVRMPEIKVPTPNVIVNPITMDKELKTLFQQLIDKKIDCEMEVLKRDTLGRITKVRITSV